MDAVLVVNSDASTRDVQRTDGGTGFREVALGISFVVFVGGGLLIGCVACEKSAGDYDGDAMQRERTSDGSDEVLSSALDRVDDGLKSGRLVGSGRHVE